MDGGHRADISWTMSAGEQDDRYADDVANERSDDWTIIWAVAAAPAAGSRCRIQPRPRRRLDSGGGVLVVDAPATAAAIGGGSVDAPPPMLRGDSK